MTNTEMMVASIDNVAHAITANVAGGTDASGGHVTSLAEAVMGITAGLMAVAEAINRHNDIMEHGAR